MCTIILAHDVFDREILASNRDELYDRDFQSPKKIREENKNQNFWAVAPRDNLKGGTWIGFNSNGIISAISNISSFENEEENRKRSRGLLCLDTLFSSSISDAKQFIKKSISQNKYDGFNLVVSSKDRAFVAVNARSFRFIELDPGIHVFTNSIPESPDKKAEKVKDEIPSTESLTSEEWIEEMKQLLSRHNPEICVHKDDRGTTSSSILSVNSSFVKLSTYLFTGDKPCQSNYREVF